MNNTVNVANANRVHSFICRHLRVYRLFLVNFYLSREAYGEKQKQIETEVFTIYVGGLVIH